MSRGAEGEAGPPSGLDGQDESWRGVSSTRAWLAVGVLLVFSLLSYVDRQIIALLVGPIKADLGLTDVQFGLLQGLAFALLYSVAGLPIGWAVDRYPRRTVIFIGVTVWSLSSVFCGLARNFWQLFMGRTLVGVGEAALAPTAVSLISDLFPRERVATPIGVFSAGFYLGGGFALVIGGWIVSLFAGHGRVSAPLLGDLATWQAVLIVTGLPGVLLAFLAFTIPDPRAWRRPSSVHRGNTADVHFPGFLKARWRVVTIAFAGYGLSSTVGYAISSWTPAYLMRVFGWDATRTGYTFGMVVAFSGMVGALLGGIVMDRAFRSGRRDAPFLTSGTVSAIAAPLLVGAYWVNDPLLTIVLLCGGMTMMGVIAAGSYVTWQTIAPATLRGQLTAAFVLVNAISGAACGPLLVGLVTDKLFGDEQRVGSSIALVAGLGLLTISILLLTGRPEMRKLP